MLAFAGLLLAGGVYAWMAYNNEKQQEADVAENSAPHRIIATRKPDAQPPKSDTTGDAATTNGAKPPVVAVRPQANPAPTAIKSELDKMPPVVRPVANVVPPGSAAKPIPAVAVKPVPAPPVKPMPAVAIKPAVPPVVVANPHSGMDTSFKPMPHTAPPVNALNVRAGAKPTAIAVLPPVAAPAAVAEPVAAAASVPAGSGVVATTEAEASGKARKEAGRNDPMQILSGLFPFPRSKKAHGDAAGPGDVPPPPGAGDETAAAAAGEQVNNGGIGVKGKIAEKLVPPPPPGGDGGGPGDIPIDILPPPPSRPMISDKLQVVSILDDHAIITFPRDLRTKNKWPAYITLAVGEQFDSLKVVGITPDGVTVEEDGERSLKPLPNIK